MTQRRGRRGVGRQRFRRTNNRRDQPEREGKPSDTKKDEDTQKEKIVKTEEESSDHEHSQDQDKHKKDSDRKNRDGADESRTSDGGRRRREEGGDSRIMSLLDVDVSRMKMVDIPEFRVEDMRSLWKWSIRIQPITPEDAAMSGLMTMPKVQDAYYYLPRRDLERGQLELCIQTTNDTVLAMLRILRTPFTHRTITVELTKRTVVRSSFSKSPHKAIDADGERTEETDGAKSGEAKADKSADETFEEEAQDLDEEAMEEDGQPENDGEEEVKEEEVKEDANKIKEKDEKGVESKAEEKEEVKVDTDVSQVETGKEEEDKAAKEKESTKDASSSQKADARKPGFSRAPVWNQVKETATLVVNLNKVQKIKFTRRVKGEISRRCVYVGTLPRSTTEEMLKVIFPMANGITMKPTDDSKLRHAFIETCHHYNAVGFMVSYPGVKVNGQELKLSVKEKDLAVLKKDEKSTKPENKDDKTEEAEGKEGGEKTEAGEKKSVDEEGKDSGDQVEWGNDAEMKDEEKREDEQSAEEEMEKGEKTSAGEGSEEKKDKDKAGNKDDKRNKKELNEEEKQRKQEANRIKKKRKRSFLDEIQREWSIKRSRGDSDGMGMHSPVGRGPMGPGRARSRGGFISFNRGGPGLVGPAPPVIHMQDKIAGLMRLQNQLELTIHNQMSIIEHSEAVRQQTEMRMRNLDSLGALGGGRMMGARGVDLGARAESGRLSDTLGRNYGRSNKGGGGRLRDFQRNTSRDERLEQQGSDMQDRGFGKRPRRDSGSGNQFRGRSFKEANRRRTSGIDERTSRSSSGDRRFAAGRIGGGSPTKFVSSRFGGVDSLGGGRFSGFGANEGNKMGGSSSFGGTSLSGGGYWGTGSYSSTGDGGGFGSSSLGGNYGSSGSNVMGTGSGFSSSSGLFSGSSGLSSSRGTGSGFGSSYNLDSYGTGGHNWNTSFSGTQGGSSGFSSSFSRY